MLYGAEYGGPARCSNCDSRTWTTCTDCYFCGAPRCNECAGTMEDRDDSTGYRGEELICERCATLQVKDIVCECCLLDRADVIAYREEYPTAVCCGKPGILVQSERRTDVGQSEVA